MSESRINLLGNSGSLPADNLEAGNGPQTNAPVPARSVPVPARSGLMSSYLEQSSHPVALVFFLLFRTGALLTYMFGTFFTTNFALIFVITTLLLAFDFWTVKNVSGRLLVGLRWWNEIREDGGNHWVFESAAPSRKNNPVDSRIFWTVLYVTPAIWILFTFLSLLSLIFSPEWLLIIAVALALNIPNVYAYTQCDADAKRRWATGLATNAVMGSGGVTGFMGRMVSQGVGSLFSRG